jgi:hypothetical protein
MPTTRTRKRKPITTRKATPAELDPRTGRERKEDAAKVRASKPRRRRGKPRTKATAVPATSPHDFQLAGVRFHNARQENGYWLVDVSNGPATYTLHNRHGSWMHNVDGEGRMAEPVRVARALGTGMGQLEISQALMERVARETGTTTTRRTRAKTTAEPAENTNQQEEATMARKPTTKTAAKPAKAKPAASSNGRTKAATFTLSQRDAKAIAKRLREGTTMKEIREEFGHSDGSKVREALRQHGIGSKGQPNPDKLTPTEWRAKYGNGEGDAKPARKRAAKAEPEPEEVEEDEEEAEEEDDEAEAAAEETADERRKRLRRERRQAKKAEEAKPKRRRSKPKATAADPS